MKSLVFVGLIVGGLSAVVDMKSFNKDFGKGWNRKQTKDITLPKIVVEMPETGEQTLTLPTIVVNMPQTEANTLTLPKIIIDMPQTDGNTVQLPKISVDLPVRAFNEEFTLEDIPYLDFKALFEAWKVEFGKSYDTIEEEADRYLVFIDGIYTIASENSKEMSYKLAGNQFLDMTREEFREYVGSCRPDDQPFPENLNAPKDFTPVGNPTKVDWRDSNAVTPVKNQGSCGSCWAFSSTGALECQGKIHSGKLTSLSEQQLVDCSGSYGNYGCNGGWWYNAFDYVKDNGGLCSESEYGYTGRDGTCKSSSCGTKYNPISGYTSVTKDSSSALETAVAKGCVSIGVEADQTAWQYYSSGVLTGNCGTSIDHGVLAVGYDNSGSLGSNYWIVKNSWGTGWGQGGYIYVCKDCNKNGNNGECGILMYDAYPDMK